MQRKITRLAFTGRCGVRRAPLLQGAAPAAGAASVDPRVEDEPVEPAEEPEGEGSEDVGGHLSPSLTSGSAWAPRPKRRRP